MNPRMPLRGRFGWQALSSPWLVGLLGAFVVAMGHLHDVARVLRRSAEVARRLEVARAHLVADTAALAAFAAGSDGLRFATAAGDEAAVHRDGDVVRIEARLATGKVHWFDGEGLAGAPPATLTRPLSFVAHRGGLDDGLRIPAAELPCLDPAAVAGAIAAEATPLLRRDAGTALLHWQAGTDADDFVFVEGAGPVDLSTVGSLLVVRGHLWIPTAPAPLEVRLAHDLVVVVQGNLYLGRSLRVRGSGRLLFVTATPATASSFVDADGNGRWSPGDALLGQAGFRGAIEGAGNVYCGLRGTQGRVECGAGLVVGGELHLLADAEIAGPVVLAHGATAVAAGARLHARGEWWFHPERESVPGFVARGEPRPGLLRPRLPPPGAAATMAKQALYLSSLPR